MEKFLEVSNIDWGEITMVGAQMQLPPSSPDAFKQLLEQLNSKLRQIEHRIDNDNTFEITSEDGTKFMIAVAVSKVEKVPNDLVVLPIPASNYATFTFEEKHIGAFWDYFCNHEARQKYNLDTVKPRLELFNSELQPRGFTKIFYPTNQ